MANADRFTRRLLGWELIHLTKTFLLLSVWDERLSGGFQLGRREMWLLTLRFFWQERGEEGYEWNSKWKWTRMLGMVLGSLKKSLIAR
jgi:hypothetical protein